MDYAEPILVTSDLHLAHPASYLEGPEELGSLIRQTRARTVIFNGDSVEMRLEHVRQKGEEMVAGLSAVCRENGAEPVFVCGNHDPKVSELHVVELAGGRVIITHGHVLFPQIVPWSREARAAWVAHREKLEAHGGASSIYDPQMTLEQRFHALQEACLAYETAKVEKEPSPLSKVRMVLRELWPPTRPFTILRTWIKTPRLARRFAETYYPQARFIITGHTHRAGVWVRHGKAVINLGSFTPLSGRLALVIDEGILRVHPIRETTGNDAGPESRWHLGDPIYDEPIGSGPPAG